MGRIRWFERTFTFDLPLALAPDIVERLRGTPARLEERLRSASPGQLTARPGERWSVQEHAGHLGDLEPLWRARLEDFLAGRAELTTADLSNRATDAAGHNDRPLREVLETFRTRRAGLVAALDSAAESDWARTATHPRLRTPMRLLDLAVFVAEHDDHHLAAISNLLRG